MSKVSFGSPRQWGTVQRIVLGIAVALTFGASTAAAQDSVRAGVPGPQSRADLEAQATRLEQEAASSSDERGRTAKLEEAKAIRDRLRDGDFKVGDRIVVSVDSGVAGSVSQPDSFTVREGRMVEFPGLPPISLNGVLYSELSDYLTQQLSRYFRNPSVHAYPLLRIAIYGPVANPGFYSLPADVLLSDAIMHAGGPAQTARMDETVVKRGEREIIGEREVQRALVYGYTLSQMNLRDGDAIHVGGANPRNWTNILRAASIGVGLAVTIYGISTRF